MLVDNIIGWIRKLTEAGVAVIALAVVVQIIFGNDAAFLPGDIIGTLTGIVTSLGAAKRTDNTS